MLNREYKFDYENKSKLPTIQIKDRIFTINNRMSNLKKLDDLRENGEDTKDTDLAFFDVLLGEGAGAFIEELDLPVDAFGDLVEMLMEAVQGSFAKRMSEGDFRKFKK